MSSQLQTLPSSDRPARTALWAGLQARRAEIEQAITMRVYSVSDPSDTSDPEYIEGLRMAVSAALDYGLGAVERGEERSPPIPAVLLIQARLAARIGVRLDTVLRRYFAGYSVLGDFIMQITEEDELREVDAMRSIGRDQAVIMDRLIAAVTEEYTRELGDRRDSTEERRAERVRRLLAGEPLDTSGFGYEFDAWHLGMLCEGSGIGKALRELAQVLDRSLLAIRGTGGTTWAWLGGRGQLDLDDVLAAARDRLPVGLILAIGEPGEEFAGWRLTHRQAMAALPLARRAPQEPIRYADVALLASALQDDLLRTSLHQLYLEPLAEGRDGGVTLRRTLRAYFAAERNVSSAAAILGVSRRTVANRLHTVESRIDRPLATVLTELDLALRLAELDA